MKTNKLVVTVYVLLLCIFHSLAASAQTEKNLNDGQEATADRDLQPTATIRLGARATPEDAQAW